MSLRRLFWRLLRRCSWSDLQWRALQRIMWLNTLTVKDCFQVGVRLRSLLLKAPLYPQSSSHKFNSNTSRVCSLLVSNSSKPSPFHNLIYGSDVGYLFKRTPQQLGINYKCHIEIKRTRRKMKSITKKRVRTKTKEIIKENIN